MVLPENLGGSFQFQTPGPYKGLWPFPDFESPHGVAWLPHHELVRRSLEPLDFGDQLRGFTTQFIPGDKQVEVITPDGFRVNVVIGNLVVNYLLYPPGGYP